MAQYRATIQGQRGDTSRLGSKNSGISGTINAWDIGVHVQIVHEHGEDVMYVDLTHGSHGGGVCTIGVYKLINGTPQRMGGKGN